MKAVEGKNIVKDIESKKLNWKDFGVPDWLIFNLTGMPLKYEKPSVIQAKSISSIVGNRN
jgi:superfamily II DNA/RNA helicase